MSKVLTFLYRRGLKLVLLLFSSHDLLLEEILKVVVLEVVRDFPAMLIMHDTIAHLTDMGHRGHLESFLESTDTKSFLLRNILRILNHSALGIVRKRRMDATEHWGVMGKVD